MVTFMDRQKVAAEAVDKIIADLGDRSGLRSVWDSLDDDVKNEIRDTWKHIVVIAVINGESAVIKQLNDDEIPY